ncbi:MAG TPA: hypothetical protein VG712_08135 [Gemmatimonadales bacterium]|nr:hypothetical protein [Gemmatimonadales bacterium]
MQPATTAEWTCARCGSTNRKLLIAGTTEAKDQCVTCHAKHELKQGERPVRWGAKLAG